MSKIYCLAQTLLPSTALFINLSIGIALHCPPNPLSLHQHYPNQEPIPRSQKKKQIFKRSCHIFRIFSLPYSQAGADLFGNETLSYSTMWSTAREIAAGDTVILWLVRPFFSTMTSTNVLTRHEMRSNL